MSILYILGAEHVGMTGRTKRRTVAYLQRSGFHGSSRGFAAKYAVNVVLHSF
jgi:hypothetical protein